MCLEQFYRQLSPLTEEAKNDLTDVVKTSTVKKGRAILRRGAICQNIYFVQNGLCKTSFLKENKEFIMRFFNEGSIFTVLDSFVTQSPSVFAIDALEPTTYISITYAQMHALCRKHHSMETFYRELVSYASVNMMKRISELLEDSASERYAKFIKESPNLLQRISLGDLSSYLGITQVSLSRIRAIK
jgi:CRP-like cAMP-binding protein